jgi:hypothetical protein
VGVWGDVVDGREGDGDRSDGVGDVGVDISVRVWGERLGEVGGGVGDGSDEDVSVSQEKDDSRRLDSSSQSMVWYFVGNILGCQILFCRPQHENTLKVNYMRGEEVF